MPFDPRKPTGNQLLDAVPFAELKAITLDFEWVEHAQNSDISLADEPMAYAYFPVSGMFSAISMFDPDSQVEVGLIGKEGFAGGSIVLMADHDPFRLISQASGRALRLPSAKLLDACETMPAFRAVLLRFIHTFMVQTASTVVANSTYVIEDRLARWILMSQDRIGTTSFPMTQQFMSYMLTVRRAGVTLAIASLEDRHLVHTTRGNMTVLDRHGLEALAAGSYGPAERAHRRLIVPAARA